jgi:hypothetical protein
MRSLVTLLMLKHSLRVHRAPARCPAHVPALTLGPVQRLCRARPLRRPQLLRGLCACARSARRRLTSLSGWNSTSFDEFSRKWNRPVHSFLLRHVYAATISTYGLNKFSAAFVTFLLSACLHELVMAVVTKVRALGSRLSCVSADEPHRSCASTSSPCRCCSWCALGLCTRLDADG